MTEDLVLTYAEKPSRFALQEAISCFDENAPTKSPDEMTNALLAIVGEACSLLAEGKTKAETISSLKLSGLSEECSTPFVEKAVAIVDWNQRVRESAVRASKRRPLLVFGLLLLLAAAAFVASRV